MNVVLVVILSFFLFSQPVHAGVKAGQLQNGREQIQLDGQLNEAVWRGVEPHAQFYQTQPFDGVAAHLRTEVRVLFDAQYLYVGVKGFDHDPQQIRDSFSRRDKISVDQDFFGLFIDPSGAHKSAQVFYVNARGAVMDGVYGDMTGDDTAPDYDFDVATARFEGGWSAEYRIPFSSIAYDKNSTTPWSLLVMRNMTRDQRYRMYSGAVTRATTCNLCFSDPIEGLSNLPSAMNWSATPQLVARRLREDVAGSTHKQTHSRDLSLDLKFRPTSAMTIDATLNPDFSQIELDSPQLSGNTRFSLFVPEKRPFFLEGADIFRTLFNAISTRSIANPDAGLRYTQRDADRDFSMLTTRDAAGGLVLIPHTYYTAYANSPVTSTATDARANFRLGALSLGMVATDRTYAQDRGANRVIGPDFIWQMDRNQLMRGQLLMSTTTAHADAAGNLVRGASRDGHAAYFDWFQGDDAWAFSTNLREISKDFRSDNGFFSQVGYRSVNAEVQKKFGRRGVLNELNLFVGGEYKLDSEGRIISKVISPGVRLAGPYDSSAYLSISPAVHSRVSEQGGAYSVSRVAAGVAASPNKFVARVSLEMSAGDVIDILANRLGRGGSISMGAKLRPLDRLEVEPSYARSWINKSGGVDDGARAYTESAIQINSIVHLSAQDTIRMILQDARTSRNRHLYDSLVVPESRRSVRSFVYTHRTGVGTATYLGWTKTLTDVPGFSGKKEQAELFAKLSWQN